MVGYVTKKTIINMKSLCLIRRIFCKFPLWNAVSFFAFSMLERCLSFFIEKNLENCLRSGENTDKFAKQIIMKINNHKKKHYS